MVIIRVFFLLTGGLTLATLGTAYCILLSLTFGHVEYLRPVEGLVCRVILLSFGQWLVVDQSKLQLRSRKTRLYVINHASFLDLFIMAAAVPEPASTVGAKEYFSWPVVGWLMKLRLVPIDRHDKVNAKEAMLTIAKRMEQGMSMAIAPEGTRSADGRLSPFKTGAAKLALSSEADIVLVAIKGAYESWPKGALGPKPGVVRVIFSSPIPYDGGYKIFNDRPDDLSAWLHHFMSMHMKN